MHHMHNININISSRKGQEDLAKALQLGMAPFGSLSVSREAWAKVLGALGLPVFSYLAEAGRQGQEMGVAKAVQALAEEAVPEEGDIHLQRALAEEGPANDGATAGACFRTPGGVLVEVWVQESDKACHDQLAVAVRFNRDSHQASFEVLAGFASALGVKAVMHLIQEWMASAEGRAEIVERYGDGVL